MRHLILTTICGLTSGLAGISAGSPAAATAPATIPATAPTAATTIAGSPTATQPKHRGDKWFVARHEQLLEQATKGNIDLYFVGDSITAAWNWNDGGAVWGKYFSGWKVANFGLAGDQTQHVLWRLQNGEFEGVRPKVVVLLIGTNNFRRDTVEDIAAGVTAIVKEIQKQSPTTRILLMGIFPRGEKADDPIRAKLKQVNGLIAKLDDGERVKYMDIGDKFMDADGALPKTLMPDALHLSAKGYEVWGEAIKPQLTQWLGAPAAK